jgi:ferrochelatase
MSDTAVLLMGFGGPDSLDSVEPFMRNLMGREPSPELVQRVQRRYLTIGGKSPLFDIATSMAEALEQRLIKAGYDVPVTVGMRYWQPYIGDTLRSLHESGVRKVIAVSLSPFESKISHGAYREAIAEALDELPGLSVDEAAPLWHLSEYVDFHAAACASAIEEIKAPNESPIDFTAHSLPVDEIAQDGSYVEGLRSTADGVAASLALDSGRELAMIPGLPGIAAYGNADGDRTWLVAFQSKGNRPVEWLGPDLSEVIATAADSGTPSVVVCPIGFATDHMETLYDLDVVAAGEAIDRDMDFARSPVPNDHEILMDGLAAALIRQL